MVDVGSIAAAIGSLRAASELTKGFLDLKEAAAVQGRVIELQSVILSAQSSAMAAQSDQMTLLEEIRGLKEKMAKLEAWETEKQRYQLTDFGSGTFAFVLKPEKADGEPPHKICANCYNEGQKSILQFSHNSGSRQFVDCRRCKTQTALGTPTPYRRPPDSDGGNYF